MVGETGVMHLHIQDGQGLPALTHIRETWNWFSFRASEKKQPYWHLDFERVYVYYFKLPNLSQFMTGALENYIAGMRDVLLLKTSPVLLPLAINTFLRMQIDIVHLYIVCAYIVCLYIKKSLPESLLQSYW